MKTGIALFGYNRPLYFKKMIESLAKNDLSRISKVHIFLDHHPPTRQYYQESIDYLKTVEALPVVVVDRPENKGCGRNHILAKQYLFDGLKYDRVIIIEDDVVLDHSYLETLQNLADWAPKACGAISGYSTLTDVENLSENKVFVGCEPWFSYLMPKESWIAIKQDLVEYSEVFLSGRRYKDRNHTIIRKWLRYKFNINYPNNPIDSEIPEEQQLLTNNVYQGIQDLKRATGQDAITSGLLLSKGLVKVNLEWNRCKHIGLVGEHCNGGRIAQKLYAQNLNTFGSCPSEFVWRVPNERS